MPSERASSERPSVAGARPPATRAWLGLAAFYSASFAALAVYMQFFPVWLHDARGLDAAQVASVLACLTVARTLAGPLWAQQVDRSGRPRRVLLTLSLLSLGSFCLYAAFDEPWGLGLASFLYGVAYPPMHPVLDAFASETARHEGFSFGRLRVVGSLTFLGVVLAAGAWLERHGSEFVYPLLLGLLAALSVVAALLPSGAREPQPSDRRPPMFALLKSRPFLWLLVASAVIQGSHAPYYNLSTVHWQAHGIGKGMAGAIWAVGVLAEIVLFWFARSTADRLRPTTLIAIGGAAAAVRWSIVGLSTELPALFASSWLHALSFGCTYLGALRALDRRVPPERRATAQGLLGAASSGVGMVVGGLLGGLLYDRFAGGAFLAMALWGVAGFLLAIHLRRLADKSQSDADASERAKPT
ncbi:MAG: hypothetical protein RL398_732 [Planctomycetota bacterium]